MLEKQINEIELQLAVNEMVPDDMQIKPAIAHMYRELERLKAKQENAPRTIVPPAALSTSWFTHTYASQRFMRRHFVGCVLKPLSRRSADIQFSKAPPWRAPWCGSHVKVRVSDASVARARHRAEQAAAIPRSAETTHRAWKEPATEPVSFLDQWEMFFDEKLQDESRLDKEQIGKEARDVVSVASRRRVYTADELYTIKVGDRGQFSNDKREALALPGTELVSRDERHRYDMWPRFTEPVGVNLSGYNLKVRPLTLQEVERGFAATTALANKISGTKNKEVSKIVNARTASARAYQAAELVLRLYRFGDRDDRRIPYLREARIVYQTIMFELLARDYEKRIEQVSRGRRKRGPSRLLVVPFMLAPGRSSTDAWLKFNRDASDLRKLLNEETDLIEAKYGRFCREVVPPRIKGGVCYTGNRSGDSPAYRILDHAVEAARYRRAEAALYLEGEEWLRDAYRALAEHFERGGHIFYGPTAYGVAPGLYDGRSDKQVLKDAGVVEPEERFPPPKARRPRPNIEYAVDVGLRHGLADPVAGTDDDTAPIRDTRDSSATVLMREVSPFLTTDNTMHTDLQDLP